MLVLARELEETVVLTVGESRIVVKVVRVTNEGRVRLGFEAGPEVTIHRGEIQERIDAEKEGGEL